MWKHENPTYIPRFHLRVAFVSVCTSVSSPCTLFYDLKKHCIQQSPTHWKLHKKVFEILFNCSRVNLMLSPTSCGSVKALHEDRNKNFKYILHEHVTSCKTRTKWHDFSFTYKWRHFTGFVINSFLLKNNACNNLENICSHHIFKFLLLALSSSYRISSILSTVSIIRNGTTQILFSIILASQSTPDAPYRLFCRMEILAGTNENLPWIHVHIH